MLPLRLKYLGRLFRTTRPVWHPLIIRDIFTFLTKLWIRFSLHVFFREMHVFGQGNVPLTGPVIFIGNHPNQFVDGMMLFSHSPRRFGFLIAAKSLSKLSIRTFLFFIGGNVVSVTRPQDLVKKAPGLLTSISASSPESSRQLRVIASNANLSSYRKGEALVISGHVYETPKGSPAPRQKNAIRTFVIDAVVSDTEVECHEEFSTDNVDPGDVPFRPVPFPSGSPTSSPSKVLSSPSKVLGSAGSGGGAVGMPYQRRPKVDHTQMYRAIYERLCRRGSICVFPEGGSHDRPRMLPLRAGCAMFALGAATSSEFSAQNDAPGPWKRCLCQRLLRSRSTPIAPPSRLEYWCPCAIWRRIAMAARPFDAPRPGEPAPWPVLVPFGLTYYHGDRFRSRAFLEFGQAIELNADMVAKFSAGGEARSSAVSELMEKAAEGIAHLTYQVDTPEDIAMLHSLRQLFLPPTPVPVRAHIAATRSFAELMPLLRASEDPKIKTFLNDVEVYTKERNAFFLTDKQVASVRGLVVSGRGVGMLVAQRIIILVLSSIMSLPALVFGLPTAGLANWIANQRQRTDLARSAVKIAGLDVVASYKILTGMGLIVLTILIWAIGLGCLFASLRVFFLSLIAIPLTGFISLQFVDMSLLSWRSLMPLLRAVMLRDYTDALVRLFDERNKLSQRLVDMLVSLASSTPPEAQDNITTLLSFRDQTITSTKHLHRLLGTTSSRRSGSVSSSRWSQASNDGDLPSESDVSPTASSLRRSRPDSSESDSDSLCDAPHDDPFDLLRSSTVPENIDTLEESVPPLAEVTTSHSRRSSSISGRKVMSEETPLRSRRSRRIEE